jgi:GNAT superfamily N-acetyltransferase
MPPPQSPLFCGTELAARIERAEADMIASAATACGRASGANTGAFVMRLAGGVASFARPGAPMNKVVGLGFSGRLDSDELDAVERAFGARELPVQVELSSLADPAAGALLTERGYRLIGFENVLGLRLGGTFIEAPASEVAISICERNDRSHWVDLMVEGFLAPDLQGRPSHESFARDVIAQILADLTSTAGFVALLARSEGAFVAGASFRITNRIAQLTGAATLPPHRRRGIQTALLAARLAEAKAAGCDLAVITTSPGSRSQENASRRHFSLLYTRAILVKSPQG